jgi:hypothetical protein
MTKLVEISSEKLKKKVAREPWASVSEPAAHSLTKAEIWGLLLTLAHEDENFKTFGSLTQPHVIFWVFRNTA